MRMWRIKSIELIRGRWFCTVENHHLGGRVSKIVASDSTVAKCISATRKVVHPDHVMTYDDFNGANIIRSALEQERQISKANHKRFYYWWMMWLTVLCGLTLVTTWWLI